MYAQDSWTIGEKLTLNLGLRYDHSVGHHANTGVDALTFNDIAPRLFATYDLSGDGKTVIKGGWGRYYQALFASVYDDFNAALPTRAFFVFNSGAGGCGGTVPGFPNVGGGPECFEGIDQPNVDVVSLRDPLATIAIDPDMKNHYMDQYAVSFERELLRDISLGVTFIHKEDSNLFAAIDNQSVYESTTVEDPLTGAQIDAWYRTSPAEDVLETMTNRNDVYFRKYNGLEILFKKRYRNNWQFLGSWTIQKAEGTHNNDTDGGTFRGSNPNDLINTDGELLNSRRHVFKLQGSYFLPRADVLFGWTYGIQSGRTYDRIIRARLPNRVNVLTEPRGSRRLDTRYTLDLRIEKKFNLGKGQLGILADIFNLANNAAVTGNNPTTGDAFELPNSVTEPRKIQLGVRYIF
jgi:outer membrane receptor protein involved in Fe transport